MATNTTAKTIYEFTVKDIDGNNVSLEKYRGKVALIVNVASQWGFTAKNYSQLQEMYVKYDGKLAVLGFPCNQFGKQEPGCDIDIKEFAKKRGVTFDLFSKIDVNGDGADPLYKFLKKAKGGFFGDAIKWNFTKFLVDREGNPVERYAPTTAPVDICKDIDKLVA